MSEPTEEMIKAYKEARAALNREQAQGRPPVSEDRKILAGLSAVLEIERRDAIDVVAAIRQAYERGQSDERALTVIMGPLR